MMAAKASRNLGLDRHVTFSGALAWPYVYPWPQRPEGLIENAFNELSNRWKPLSNPSATVTGPAYEGEIIVTMIEIINGQIQDIQIADGGANWNKLNTLPKLELITSYTILRILRISGFN